MRTSSKRSPGWLLPIALVCLAAAACGGDDDDDGDAGGDGGIDASADTDAGADAGEQPDAASELDGDLPIDASIDAGTGTEKCPLGETLPSIPLNTQEASQEPLDPKNPDGPQFYTLVATQDTIALQIDLYDGAGAFEGGAVEPGTYTIQGDDTDPTGCGLCIRATVDHPDLPPVLYAATAGTLELTSVEGDLSGIATDLTLQEFLFRSPTPLPDGCTTAVGSIEFNAPIAVQASTGRR